ncbi:hypothetical protein KVT40_003021 [Elsinoe batatas]|uniref:N-acetyltransferase domain-containing protein n=1 Tax=Elsinoe batatas TaxID=2601811 RepID=A0A8K0L3B5_9PEZI|nr:hypothetical protein KVT40_003021 [Elsinoe batatas]
MQSSLSAWMKKAVEPIKSVDKSPKSSTHLEAAALPTPSPEPQQVSHTAPRPSDLLRLRSTGHSASELQHVPHPNISILPFSKEHISPFKRINALLLPIPYGNSFYDEILADQLTASISLVATWKDDPVAPSPGKVIGGIRCRILSSASTGIEKGIASSFPSYAPGSGHRMVSNGSAQAEGEKILYISTLTLLSPYRGHGVAKALLERVERVAKEKYGVAFTGAHVWVANDDGLQWYAKRGFKEVGRDEGYYRRLDPMGAVVMRREIGNNTG